MSLHLLRSPTDGTAKVPKFPLCHVANNSTTRSTLNHSIVYDLVQCPSDMSTLEVLQTCPLQRKALLSTLGFVKPSYSRLITFDLDQGEPQMPSFVAFQVPVTVQSLVIHR